MNPNYKPGDRLVAMCQPDHPAYHTDHPCTYDYELWSIPVETDIDEDGTKFVCVEIPQDQLPPEGIFVIEQTGLVTEDNYPIWRLVNE